MKKITRIIVSFILVILIGYLSINFYTDNKLTNVEEKVLRNNPEITKVVTINSNGQWGEWFSEYTLLVEMNGLKYRIWTSEEGEITDMVLI